MRKHTETLKIANSKLMGDAGVVGDMHVQLMRDANAAVAVLGGADQRTRIRGKHGHTNGRTSTTGSSHQEQSFDERGIEIPFHSKPSGWADDKAPRATLHPTSRPINSPETPAPQTQMQKARSKTRQAPRMSITAASTAR